MNKWLLSEKVCSLHLPRQTDFVMSAVHWRPTQISRFLFRTKAHWAWSLASLSNLSKRGWSYNWSIRLHEVNGRSLPNKSPNKMQISLIWSVVISLVVLGGSPAAAREYLVVCVQCRIHRVAWLPLSSRSSRVCERRYGYHLTLRMHLFLKFSGDLKDYLTIFQVLWTKSAFFCWTVNLVILHDWSWLTLIIDTMIIMIQRYSLV